MKYVVLSALIFVLPVFACSQSEDTSALQIDSQSEDTSALQIDSQSEDTSALQIESVNCAQAFGGMWKDLKGVLSGIENSDCNLDAMKKACAKTSKALQDIGCVDEASVIDPKRCNIFLCRCGSELACASRQ
jgi:hypothetical protein